MLAARRFTRFLDRREREVLQNREEALVEQTVVNYILEYPEIRSREYSRLELQTIVQDAERFRFIQRLPNGGIVVTLEGRSILYPYGPGWLFMAEYFFARLTTLGAFVAGLVVGITAFVGVFFATTV